MAQNNDSIARSVYEAFNNKDFEALKALGSSESEWLEVPFEFSEKGQLAVHNVWQAWARIFPDGNVEVRNVVSAGDYVIAECIGRGTHQGVFKSPVGDLQPTGRRVEIPFCDVLRVRNGKIVSGHSYFDFFLFLRQLGLEAQAARAA